MKKNFCQFFLLCAVSAQLFTVNIQATPNIKMLTGWHQCFTKGKEYLSPFEGFVFSDVVEKYYQFGTISSEWAYPKGREYNPIKVCTNFHGGDANIRLLYHLFHPLGDEFYVMDVDSYPSTYLNAKAIGGIIALMDQAVQNRNRNYILAHDEISKSDLAVKNARATVAKIEENLKTAPDNVALRNKYNQAKSQAVAAEHRLQNTMTRHNFYHGSTEITSVERIIEHAIHENPKAESLGKETRKTLQSRVHNLAQTILESLEESGDMPSAAEPRYLLHTPFSSLLAFLYRKTKDINDFVHYAEQLPPAALKPNRRTMVGHPFDEMQFFNQLLARIKQAESIFRQPGGSQGEAPTFTPAKILNNLDILELYAGEPVYSTLINEEAVRGGMPKPYESQYDLLSEVVEDNYEGICIEGLLQRNNPKLPRFADKWNISSPKAEYTACVEAAVLNWIQLLLSILELYDSKSMSYTIQDIGQKLITLLAKKGKIISIDELTARLRPIINFFTKFNTDAKLHDKTNAAYYEWTDLVSNRPGIRYTQRHRTGQPNMKEYDSFIRLLGPSDRKENYAGTPYEVFDFNDQDNYLCELAGCPSTFVKLTNYFLGLECQNMAELLDLFDIQTGTPHTITDDAVYPNNTLDVIFGAKTISTIVEIRFTKGHAELFFNKDTGEDQKYDQLTHQLLRGFDKKIYRDILSCLQPKAEKIDITEFNKEEKDSRKEVLTKQLWEAKTPKEQSLITMQLFEIDDSYKLDDTIFNRYIFVQEALKEMFTPALKRHFIFTHVALEKDSLNNFIDDFLKWAAGNVDKIRSFNEIAYIYMYAVRRAERLGDKEWAGRLFDQGQQLKNLFAIEGPGALPPSIDKAIADAIVVASKP